MYQDRLQPHVQDGAVAMSYLEIPAQAAWGGRLTKPARLSDREAFAECSFQRPAVGESVHGRWTYKPCFGR